MSRPYRIALNGYGRIGRCVLRALYERELRESLTVVALNDLADLATDELTDITGQSAEDATALIMKAREHWFTNQD